MLFASTTPFARLVLDRPANPVIVRRCAGVGELIAAAWGRVWPTAGLIAALVLAAPILGGCSYGPLVDDSGVQSAALLPDQHTVAIVYRTLLYRRATGVAAFPDGGVPRYLRDSSLIAMVGISGGAPRILRRFENPGVHGSVGLSVRASDADPDHLLVLQSDQRSPDQAPARRWWRLDWRDGRVEPYPDLKADLANRGRAFGSPDFGDIRVLDPDGTLLIGARAGNVNELWIRTPSGHYDSLGAAQTFYGVAGSEIYMWAGGEAVVLNWRTGERRIIARQDPARQQTTRLILDDPTVRAIEAGSLPKRTVSVSSDASSVIIRDPGGAETSILLRGLFDPTSRGGLMAGGRP